MFWSACSTRPAFPPITWATARGASRYKEIDMRFCAVFACAAVTVYAADQRLADAARNQDAAAVRTLIQQHADVNGPDVDGTTALIYAAHQNNLELVKALLAAGANAKAANRYQVTALAEACNLGNS